MKSERTLGDWFPEIVHWNNLPACASFLFLCIGIIGSNLLFTSIPKWIPVSGCSFSINIINVLLILIGCCISNKWIRYSTFLVVGFLLYLFLITTYNTISSIITHFDNEEHQFSVTIISPPVSMGSKIACMVKLYEIDNVNIDGLSGKHFICTSREYPGMDGDIVFTGRIRSASQRKHKYGYNEIRSYMARGIAGEITIEHLHSSKPPKNLIERYRSELWKYIVNVLKMYPETVRRSVIRAAVTGQRSYIHSEILTMFLHSGLMHILALSGLHAGVLAGAVYALLTVFRLHRKYMHGIVIGILWGYLFWIGFIPSLVRAILMATIIISSQLLQRKPYPIHIVCLAGIVWLVISPASLFQPGFQLSYLATFGIVTIFPRIRILSIKSCNDYYSILQKWIWMPFAVSVSVCITTFPVLLYHFGAFAPYGLITTIIVLPMMTAALWLFYGALLTTPIITAIGVFFIWTSDKMIYILLLAVKYSSRIPIAYIPVPALYIEAIIVYYIMVIVLICIHKDYFYKTCLFCGILLLCFLPAHMIVRQLFSSPTVTLMENGKGDYEILIRWPTGSACMLHTGIERNSRVIMHSLPQWLHHFPGTHVHYICYCDEQGMLRDTLNNKNMYIYAYSPDDTIIFLSDTTVCSSEFECRYIPRMKLLEISRKEYVIDCYIDRMNCRITQKTAQQPICPDTIWHSSKLILMKHGYKTCSFN